MIRSALRYLKQHGPRAFYRRAMVAFGVEFVDRYSIDEVRIVVKVLGIKKYRGVMIDVGAHHGSASLPFCRAQWDVYCFEPDSCNRGILVKNISPYSNARIDSRAISNRKQDAVTLYRSSQSTGISGLSAFHSSHVAADTVSVTTLKAVVNENSIDRIDFLKVDTEGFDKFVLEGVPWESHPPKVIVAEFEDRKTQPLGYSFHDLAAYLADKGYRVMVSEWEPVVAYGGRHRWADFKEYPCNLSSANAWGNFIASRDATVFQRIAAECDRINNRMSKSNLNGAKPLNGDRM